MGYISELRKLVGSRPIFMVGAGVLLLDIQGRVLLQHRTDSHDWSTPGGACELGESLEQTARRELKEETGLEVGELELFCLLSGQEFYYKYPNGDEVYNISAMFVGRYEGNELTPDIAQTVVDFAHAESRRTNFQVQNLAGISQYLDAALASNATPVAPAGDQPQQTSFLSFADPPSQTEDEKEQAYQILSSLPLAEQEHWAELAREELKRSNSAVFKRISTFSVEVQLETLLSNAAKFFTGEILGLKTRVKAPKKPRVGS